MKVSQILFIFITLLTTEARSSPKSPLTPPKHYATSKQQRQRAFINKSDLPSPQEGDVRAIRGGGGGEATMTNEMFNMVKAVVGVGVLSLPAGKLSMYDY